MTTHISKDLSFDVIEQQDDFIVINKAADTNFHDENSIGMGLFNQVKKKLQLNSSFLSNS